MKILLRNQEEKRVKLSVVRFWLVVKDVWYTLGCLNTVLVYQQINVCNYTDIFFIQWCVKLSSLETAQ